MTRHILYPALAIFIFSACNNHHVAAPQAAVKDNMALPLPKDTTAAPAIPALDTAVSAAKLIVPGKSIGLTQLDEKTATAIKVLGKPDSQDAAMGKSILTWYAKNAGRYETDVYSATNMGNANEASRVKQVRITSPYFTTAQKLGVGAALETIQQQYPAIQKTGKYTITKTGITNYIYDAVDEGIAFEIDPANKCIGVNVHLPKDKAFETYLGFFENYVAL